MQPRLLTVRRAEYIPAPYSGKNESGCKVVGDRVLVRPDIAAEKAGQVFLSQQTQDSSQMSASTGVIVGVGDDAFAWNTDRSRPWAGYKPIAGDRIYFEKYAGRVVLGKDGVEYRLMDDKCIGGIEEKGKS